MTLKLASQGTARHIYHELITEKLEIACAAGLVADYVVSATKPTGHIQARVTVCCTSTATDESTKEYLGHLLHNLVPAQNITLTPLRESRQPRLNDHSEPRFLSRSENSTNALRHSSPKLSLQKLATVGAMLICVAVVVNVGPFAKAPVADSRDQRIDLRGSLLTVEEPSGFPRPEVDLRTVPNHSQSAGTLNELPEAIGLLMQPPPFALAHVGRSASEPRVAQEDGYSKYPLESPTVYPEQTGDHLTTAKPTVLGFWAPDKGACSARAFQEGVLPTMITSEGAWAGETFCVFRKRKETDTGWQIFAECSAPRERWTSNVRLMVTGDRLTWSSKRGTQTYTRCRPDVLLAQAR